MPSIRFRKFCQTFGEQGDHIVSLVTIRSPLLGASAYLNSSHETVPSQGRTFIGVGLDFVLPSQTEQHQPTMQLRLPAVTQQIIKFLDEHPSKFDVDLEVVLRQTPDVIELGPYRMRSESSAIDMKGGTASMECKFNFTLDLPLVTKKFTRRMVPGAYGAGA